MHIYMWIPYEQATLVIQASGGDNANYIYNTNIYLQDKHKCLKKNGSIKNGKI